MKKTININPVFGVMKQSDTNEQGYSKGATHYRTTNNNYPLYVKGVLVGYKHIDELGMTKLPKHIDSGAQLQLFGLNSFKPSKTETVYLVVSENEAIEGYIASNYTKPYVSLPLNIEYAKTAFEASREWLKGWHKIEVVIPDEKLKEKLEKLI